MKWTLTAFMLLLWIMPRAGAQEASFESLFRSGLEASRTKAYDQAQKDFQAALKLEPRNVAAMTNLALTYSHLEEPGYAIAWFRRALAEDPTFRPARQGLEFSLSRLEIKEIPHRIETFESLRTYFLQYVSLSQFLFLTLVLLLFSGWKLLSWIGSRRRAKRAQDEVPPPFPLSTATLLLLLVLSAAFSALKASDLASPRGTVVAVKVDALSAPGADGVSLFELHQGFEVLVGEMQGDWIQVTYPGGSTGWIPKKDLIPAGGGL